MCVFRTQKIKCFFLFLSALVAKSIEDLDHGTAEYRSIKTSFQFLLFQINTFVTKVKQLTEMSQVQLDRLKEQEDPCSGWGFFKFICRPLITSLTVRDQTQELAVSKLKASANSAVLVANELAEDVAAQTEGLANESKVLLHWREGAKRIGAGDFSAKETLRQAFLFKTIRKLRRAIANLRSYAKLYKKTALELLNAQS